jgi:hypothetical protein
MTIRHLYPAAEPSLNLDFANSKSLDPRITFTRLSIGTYTDENGIIRTAADNEARFDHDSDGNSLGLLIEESRTNLITESADLPAIFVGTEVIASPNAGTAPDGTLTATKVAATTASALHFYQATVSSLALRTLSLYAKADGENIVNLGIYPYTAQNIEVDLSTGTIVTGTGTVTPAGNGWYRISYTVDYPGRYTFVIMPGGRNSNPGDGASGVLVWGAQLEEGDFPTSYIPTAGSTVTRSPDVASMTGTNFSSWYNQGEGSVFLDFSGQTHTPADYKRLVTIADSSSDSMSAGNQISFGSHAGITTQRWFTRNGSSIAYIPLALNPPVAKTAIGFESPELSSVTYDGADIVTYNISNAIPITADRLSLFGTQTISRLSYYDRRVSDAELETLSS